MSFIKVVCGIIWKDEKILMARKCPDKPLGGYWEFPGGKVEADEDDITALQRELLEELGLEIIDIRYFDTHLYSYSSLSIQLIAYQANFKKATFILHDHDKVEFVPVGKLIEYQIAPADRYFLHKLIG